MSDVPMIHVQQLGRDFTLGKTLSRTGGTLKAVQDVSFSIARGETLGLVGESGSGKSTIARMLVGLLPPTSGTMTLFGTRIDAHVRARQWQPLRQRMQYIFQDPHAALNPRMRAGASIAEPLEIQGGMTRRARDLRVAELMTLVGLPPDFTRRFPHEFSGGQRQRIVIARALALNPDFIICDEAVASLDVSMQAQIINLLKDLQEQLGLSYLFISHDLAVVRAIAHRIAVLYAGRIVEMGERTPLFQTPHHPYTRALLDAVPRPRQRRHTAPPLAGEVPSLINPSDGCAFRSRCAQAIKLCHKVAPVLKTVGGREVACHLYQ